MASLPCCVAELSFPEQIIVWSIRRWIIHTSCARAQAWQCVEATLRQACGGGAGRLAAGALDQALFILAHRSRRPLMCHALDCAAVATGERALIDLIAASQLGDRHHGEGAARALLPEPYVRLLLDSIAVVAAALAMRFAMLPPRYAMEGAGRLLH